MGTDAFKLVVRTNFVEVPFTVKDNKQKLVPGINWREVRIYENNVPQIDHIFPQSLLRKVRVANDRGQMNLLKYRDDARNQLANCMLLTCGSTSNRSLPSRSHR